jgi:hypothetical protein
MPKKIIKKNISVDLKKFEGFDTYVKFDAYNSEFDDHVYGIKHIPVELTMSCSEKEFDKYFRSIITEIPNFNSSAEAIEELTNELIYVYTLIKRKASAHLLPTSKVTSKNIRNNLESYIKILETLDSLPDNEDFNIKLTIVRKQTYLPNQVLEVPSTDDPKKLLKSIVDGIIKHHTRETVTSGLWGILAFVKGKITISYLKTQLAKFNSEIKAGRKTTYNNAYLSLLILNYIKTLPWFPVSKKQNSILTEQQGKFIQKYFYLFGVQDLSFEVNIQKNFIEDDISFSKQLRKDLKKII